MLPSVRVFPTPSLSLCLPLLTMLLVESHKHLSLGLWFSSLCCARTCDWGWMMQSASQCLVGGVDLCRSSSAVATLVVVGFSGF